MKHSKIIVLNGFTRGGTGVVWNILQSHQQMCSPILETGEILFGQIFRFVPARISLSILTSKLINKTPLGHLLCNLIDTFFFNLKMENFGHTENGCKYDGVPYSREEVKDTYLCLKGVNLDINLTDFFAKFYKKAYFIGLIRNGYALCNGWIRRGRTADEAGKMYKIVGQRMIEYHRKYNHYFLLRFEDLIKDPFDMASKLFAFSELNPTKLEKLRLKSTRLLSVNGVHETRFGLEKVKYWFDSEQIALILDSNINKTQIELLRDRDRCTFEKHAKPVLEYFHYT